MRRLLIAEAEGVFSGALKKHLQAHYQIRLCSDGTKCLEHIVKFDPDILLIDLSLSGTDGLNVIRNLRASGRDTKVVAISGYTGEFVLAALEALGVEYVFSKPCDLGAVAGCIRDIERKLENADGWCLEEEVDRLLLPLGFRMGRGGYQCTVDALCIKYMDFHCATTKELYPSLAKKYRSNVKQVEKAIRDAIHSAWHHGNQSLWKLYFAPRNGEESYCPGNDEFIARMAKALMCKTRLKLPFVEEM